MTRVITIRHAATQYSQQQRIAGTLDVPISAEGLAQAEMVRSRVDLIQRDVVISSNLGRALHTAQICTGLEAADIQISADCKERNFGSLQGLSPAEVKKIKSEIKYVKVGQHHHSINPPGGETLDALRLRAERFRDHVLTHYRERSVLIFSHHTFLQQFHGALNGLGTHESLGRDIRFLEINFFQLDEGGGVIDHSHEQPVTDSHETW